MTDDTTTQLMERSNVQLRGFSRGAFGMWLGDRVFIYRLTGHPAYVPNVGPQGLRGVDLNYASALAIGRVEIKHDVWPTMEADQVTQSPSASPLHTKGYVWPRALGSQDATVLPHPNFGLTSDSARSHRRPDSQSNMLIDSAGPMWVSADFLERGTMGSASWQYPEGVQFLGFNEPIENDPIFLLPRQIANQLREFLSLPDDWDGDRGTHTSIAAHDRAAELLAHAVQMGALPGFIAPLPDGGLQLEWGPVNDKKLVVAIDPIGTEIEFVYIDERGAAAAEDGEVLQDSDLDRYLELIGQG